MKIIKDIDKYQLLADQLIAQYDDLEAIAYEDKIDIYAPMTTIRYFIDYYNPNPNFLVINYRLAETPKSSPSITLQLLINH